jgi:dolichol-phosphate mannosyltransferase
MIVVLLPAYNEEESLPILLPKIEQFFAEEGGEGAIVVCDDGSSDRTAQVLSSYPAKVRLEVITHKLNRGLGEASRDLFERAAELLKDDDIIIRMDCDDTHDPSFMHLMKKKLDEGHDVVIASRFQEGGGQQGVSAYRAFISRSANLFMKILFPISGVQEYSCGFRAYRAGVIRRAIRVFGNDFIQLKGLGFTCTLEKLVKLRILGARFAEVPFVLRYDRKLSVSKMVSSVTTLGYLTMAVLHYWPWGGWRTNPRFLAAAREARRGS